MTKLANFHTFRNAALKSLSQAAPTTNNVSVNGHRPVGFRQHHQQQLEPITNTEQREEDNSCPRNLYFETLLKITHDFIEAEAKGHGNSFLQFRDKYDAANKLYRQEKRDLPNQITELQNERRVS
jgi:hypothetical protein